MSVGVWSICVTASGRGALMNPAGVLAYASSRSRSEDELANGADFTRYHGDSDFIEPPKITADRNALARIRFKLVGIAKGSCEKKEKGKHSGCGEPSWLENIELRAQKAIKRVLPQLLLRRSLQRQQSRAENFWPSPAIHRSF